MTPLSVLSRPTGKAFVAVALQFVVGVQRFIGERWLGRRSRGENHTEPGGRQTLRGRDHGHTRHDRTPGNRARMWLETFG